MIGRRLREIMDHRGISRSEVAVRLGVTPQAVTRWERDDANPELGKILDLAVALSVDVGQLFQAVGSPVLGSDGGTSTEISDPDVSRWFVEFGGRLAVARQALGLTVGSIALACSVPTLPPDVLSSRWPRWERGEARPHPVVIDRFCGSYGVTFDWLCRGMVRSRLSDDVLLPLIAEHPWALDRDQAVIAMRRRPGKRTQKS